MKHIFTVFIVFVFQNTYAQDRKIYERDSSHISETKTEQIELITKAVDSNVVKASFSFSGFIVKDVRFDTTSVGVKTKNLFLTQDKNFEKLVLHNGTKGSMMQYLNNNKKYNFLYSDYTITCFVKKLWIAELDSLNQVTGNREPYHRLSFEAETYLNRENSYYPAFRIDTVTITSTKNKDEATCLTNVLNSIAAKAAALDTTKVLSRNMYSISDLEKRYSQRFDKPILKDKVLNAGVYKTFTEFVNNNPSVKQYEIKQDLKTTILYTRTTNTDWLPERTAFGFCDGKTVWISVDHIFHPLIRQGNTFEFLANYYPNMKKHKGTTVMGGSSPLVVLGSSLIATGLNNLLDDSPSGKKLFQLNMESGTY